MNLGELMGKWVRARFGSRGFTLLAGLVVATCATAFAQVLANPFLDDSTVQVINLTMAPTDWAALQQNYLLNTYYHATFTWNGISENIGIRSHGGGSRSPIKPNLDLNFAHYTKTQTFLGLPFVLLKANNEDPSNMCEWLSMKLYRKMGIPAPREAPAQVYINGQILGFYYIVEHLDETFLQRDFGESGGYLYEWQSANDYDFENLGTDPTLYSQFLDLKTSQTAPDLQTFDNLVQVINQPASATFTDDAFIAALSQYLDPKQFLTYGATEQVLAGTDSLIGGQQGMNNFDLYQFQGTTVYYFIPWDKDSTALRLDQGYHVRDLQRPHHQSAGATSLCDPAISAGLLECGGQRGNLDGRHGRLGGFGDHPRIRSDSGRRPRRSQQAVHGRRSSDSLRQSGF